MELGGVTYRLRFNWNRRAGGWFLTIKTQGGTVIVAGRRVATDAAVFRQFTDARLPTNSLIPVDLDGTRAEPGRNDLGDRIALMYE